MENIKFNLKNDGESMIWHTALHYSTLWWEQWP